MILGAVVGDVVGSVYEFHNIKTEDFPLFSDRSRFTDDTVMTLAVADALLRGREEDGALCEACVEAMRRWGRRYPKAGYGGNFARWLRSEQPAPYRSWGNGSAMRVSPVAWAASTLEEALKQARETASVTHDHPEGIRGAQAIAGAAFLVRKGAGNDEVRTFVRDRIGYALDFTLDAIRPGYTFDVSCQGSVPEAIEAFLESESFEDALRKAVSLGGDSDTIAAMAATLAQARWGVPRALEAVARERLDDDMLALNDRFCETFAVGR